MTYKILCVCNHGNVRSACMARLLKDSGHEAIAIGAEFTTEESMLHFVHWADKTIWMSEKKKVSDFRAFDTLNKENRIIIFNVGLDKWFHPFHPELIGLCNEALIEWGFR